MSSCETVDFLGAIGDLVLYLQASLKFPICSTSVCEKSDLQTPIPESEASDAKTVQSQGRLRSAN